MYILNDHNSCLLISFFYLYSSLSVFPITSEVIFLKHKSYCVITLFKCTDGFHYTSIKQKVLPIPVNPHVTQPPASSPVYSLPAIPAFRAQSSLTTLVSLLVPQINQVPSCLRTFAHIILSSRSIPP